MPQWPQFRTWSQLSRSQRVASGSSQPASHYVYVHVADQGHNAEAGAVLAARLGIKVSDQWSCQKHNMMHRLYADTTVYRTLSATRGPEHTRLQQDKMCPISSMPCHPCVGHLVNLTPSNYRQLPTPTMCCCCTYRAVGSNDCRSLHSAPHVTACHPAPPAHLGLLSWGLCQSSTQADPTLICCCSLAALSFFAGFSLQVGPPSPCQTMCGQYWSSTQAAHVQTHICASLGQLQLLLCQDQRPPAP
mmetsp:Transcript_21018/g.46117  ORF Transcript_21018/g.46117 Transcript_21018/m.46117 type:complete len:246 (-) Transcript_21018:3111-3848(-)